MNLLGRTKLGLITLLALILLGCEDPNELGLELKADSDRVGVYYQEIVLPSAVIQNDSILTSSSSRLLVGNINDEQLGRTTAKTFTQFTFDQVVKDIPEDAVFDSVALLLQHDYNYGADLVLEQEILVYELEEDLSDTAAYFSYDNVNYSDLPIGQGSYLFPNFEVATQTDTLFYLPLNTDFGIRLFESVQDTTIIPKGDNEALTRLFKGFAIVPGQNNNVMARFNPFGGEMAVVLYYHVDTLAISYEFGMLEAANFNQILADRTGTQLEGISGKYYEDFLPANQNAYLQAGTGLVTKFDLGPFVEFFDTLDNITINKAEFEIMINLPGYNQAPPSITLLYFATESNRRIKSGSEYLGILREGTTDLYNLNYDPTTQSYTVPITLFCDNLRKGLISYDKLLLFPIEFGYFNSINYLQAAPENIVLKVYYTKLK
jgi:hypothetical protein